MMDDCTKIQASPSKSTIILFKTEDVKTANYLIKYLNKFEYSSLKARRKQNLLVGMTRAAHLGEVSQFHSCTGDTGRSALPPPGGRSTYYTSYKP